MEDEEELLSKLQNSKKNNEHLHLKYDLIRTARQKLQEQQEILLQQQWQAEHQQDNDIIQIEDVKDQNYNSIVEQQEKLQQQLYLQQQLQHVNELEHDHPLINLDLFCNGDDWLYKSKVKVENYDFRKWFLLDFDPFPKQYNKQQQQQQEHTDELDDIDDGQTTPELHPDHDIRDEYNQMHKSHSDNRLHKGKRRSSQTFQALYANDNAYEQQQQQQQLEAEQKSKHSQSITRRKTMNPSTRRPERSETQQQQQRSKTASTNSLENSLSRTAPTRRKTLSTKTKKDYFGSSSSNSSSSNNNSDTGSNDVNNMFNSPKINYSKSRVPKPVSLTPQKNRIKLEKGKLSPFGTPSLIRAPKTVSYDSNDSKAIKHKGSPRFQRHLKLTKNISDHGSPWYRKQVVNGNSSDDVFESNTKNNFDANNNNNDNATTITPTSLSSSVLSPSPTLSNTVNNPTTTQYTNPSTIRNALNEKPKPFQYTSDSYDFNYDHNNDNDNGNGKDNNPVLKYSSYNKHDDDNNNNNNNNNTNISKKNTMPTSLMDSLQLQQQQQEILSPESYQFVQDFDMRNNVCSGVNSHKLLHNTITDKLISVPNTGDDYAASESEEDGIPEKPLPYEQIDVPDNEDQNWLDDCF